MPATTFWSAAGHGDAAPNASTLFALVRGSGTVDVDAGTDDVAHVFWKRSRDRDDHRARARPLL